MGPRHMDQSAPSEPQTLHVELERAVAGGVVLGRDSDGRVVLARGGLPGESVVVAPEVLGDTLVRGEVTAVRSVSPGRVEPPCRHVLAGCGGCDLQHASRGLQASMKRDVVLDALAHTASLPASVVGDLLVEQIEPAPPEASRTTLRMVVLPDGSLGLRRRRSHAGIGVPGCAVAHRVLHPAIEGARFGGAGEVLLRGSASTSEVLAVPRSASRGARRSAVPVVRSVPDGVSVVDTRERGHGDRSWVTEAVDGVDLRISAGSFFQSGPVPAAALVRAVRRALGDFDPESHRMIDLYGGVGLFTALLGARRSEVVERSAAAVSDARANTAALAAKVVRCDVARWRPSPADAVVADPARTGLGRAGVGAVVATGAPRVALVSCDAASMARDLSMLHDNGYRPDRIELVDMFPHTHHIEAVTTLRLAGTDRDDTVRGDC